jgi:hypothetical protein
VVDGRICEVKEGPFKEAAEQEKDPRATTLGAVRILDQRFG